MRIIFAGSGEFGLPALSALRDSGHDFAAIYTQPDRPTGRGRRLAPTAVGQFAESHGLPLVRTADLNAEPLPPADLLVVIAFGQKIAPHVAAHARLGSINLHASRLPRYRGAAPINWAILRGESTTGNSVIRLAQKMDAGAILAQSELTIADTETAGELHDRLAVNGAPLIAHVVKMLGSDAAIEHAQDESQATLAPKLNRAMSTIDWNHSGSIIARHIRGLSPWPGCRVELIDGGANPLSRLTLLRARPAPGEDSRWHPGEITLSGFVSAADGGTAVEILDVQPDGGRPMSLADYRRGHPWMSGMRLRSIL